MAVTKTHPIKSTLKAAIDYILNPEKTDGKLLASSFGCGLETADIEFAWTREAAGDRGTHLGRHLIQSFAVGETTPEEAHKIGMELAGAVLGGKYEFVLTTHVDKDHLHNHLIFNAVSFVDYKKYHSNKQVLPIFANTKMELPVMLAAFYGLRRSEVIGLQWSAIDFERKIVTISRTFERINVDGKMVDVSKCRTKNKASFRSLPLIPAVEQALLKAQKRQHQQMKLCGGSYCKEYKDYICVDDMGHLVTPDYVTRVFREMLVKNGFRPIRYHDLRHSCASLLIKNKVTMKEVQMWLGHSSFSTTANIYAHIDVDSKMEAANMIASKINLGELPEKKKSPKRKIA